MKKCLLVLSLLLAALGHGQHTISGTFTPKEGYTWIIAYRITPNGQNYVANTGIKDGKFSMQVSANAVPGMYRMVYAVPQEVYYFDMLYSGKEDIDLQFDVDKGATYSQSKENQIFQDYFKDINAAQKAVDSYYQDHGKAGKELKGLIAKIQEVQHKYEQESEGLMVHHFVMAGKPYIPTPNESAESYVNNKIDCYFDEINFADPVLQASSFPNDKVANYVFTALPLNAKSKAQVETAMQENVATVSQKLKGVDEVYALNLYHQLWVAANAGSHDKVADLVYTEYLKPLAEKTNNRKLISEIDLYNRLKMGATAPDITWNNGQKSLHAMKGADHYVVIFWSSTCSHCLHEIPPLHKKLETMPNVKVLAVGLEDDDVSWKKESAKLPGFEHAIALGKWESKEAQLYNIQKTPTYFILDKDKHIVAKPEDDKEVVAYLQAHP